MVNGGGEMSRKTVHGTAAVMAGELCFLKKNLLFKLFRSVFYEFENHLKLRVFIAFICMATSGDGFKQKLAFPDSATLAAPTHLHYAPDTL